MDHLETQYSVFTSESVSEGHPDKIADQISDAILDDFLRQDPNARVACEVLIKNGLVIVAGEVKSSAWIDIETVTRKVIADIGYLDGALGFDARSCAIINVISKQSADIAKGVDETDQHEQGAGDQGLMFGYACRETESFMPAPIAYAHDLMRRQAYVRRNLHDFILMDAKAQVTVRYNEKRQPIAIDTIVLSTQHAKDIDQDKLKKCVIEDIIKPVIPSHLLSDKTIYHINPTGIFEIGGPVGDCGLTGRKIIVDTYGGMVRHGGGAFSGKDPSKVDRSAAYMCRYIAKNLVAAQITDECEIQVAYAIGVAKPVSIGVNTFGTSSFSDAQIIQLIETVFDLTPKAITTHLGLCKPIYQKTAAYGHFGRDDLDLPWERIDQIEAIAQAKNKLF